MGKKSQNSVAGNLPDEEMLAVAQHLARFNLCLMAANCDKHRYASISGPTFPFDRMLRAAGAYWANDDQSWVVDNPRVLEDFVEALEREQTGSHHQLAEDAPSFGNGHNLETPLGRMLTLGPNTLENRELLELLISYDQYLADPAAVSHQLFDEFGSLGAVLACESGRLAQLHDVTPRVRCLIKAIQLTVERVLHEPVQENPIIGSWNALLDYLRARLQHQKREELLVLYLDKKNRLIKTEDTQGSVSHVMLYPRDIAARALELFASAVIIAHNHPSGDTKPSKGDVEMTRSLARALETLDIKLYDHVIVSSRSVFSFDAEGLVFSPFGREPQRAAGL